jgi:ECF sigma factor
MNEVTRILSAIHQGDANAAGQLFPLVYDELRRLAAQKLAVETPEQTLQPTPLVHEAYLRLVGDQKFEGRGPILFGSFLASSDGRVGTELFFLIPAIFIVRTARFLRLILRSCYGPLGGELHGAATPR